MKLDEQSAKTIIGMLEDAQDIGMTYVAFGPQVEQLYFFDRASDAMDFVAATNRQGQLPWTDISLPLRYSTIEQMLSEVNKANPLNINDISMNRNNWENIQDEMKQLRFNPQTIEDVREKIEKGLTDFTAHDQIKGNKGLVDITAHFRQSGQSENYYMNKFTVALNTGKSLEEGQKYFVITPNDQQPGKNISKSFINVTEAINFFKDQKGDSKLTAGKDAAHSRELATMKAGKTDYVEKDFARTFRTPAQTQTFFVERGKGFTVEQAANLIQGRAVFRDDLLNLSGTPYAAWIKLDFDTPKDKYQNYTTNQYHVPSYGFSTKEALEKFNIKEMSNPEKAEKLMKSLENGNRPLVTTTKEGQDVKLHMEASPRYRQLNFFQENGKPEKREQFLKEPLLDQKVSLTKSQGKEQEQGIAV